MQPAQRSGSRKSRVPGTDAGKKWNQPQDAWATMLVNFIDIFGEDRCDVKV